MYSYIKVKTEELNEIELMLENQGISYTSNNDSIYFSVEDRINKLMENNVIDNNIKEVDDLMDFVYSDFNPLDIDNQIMERILIYNSAMEEK